MSDIYLKAAKAHNTLNYRGWAFMRFSDLCTPFRYIAADHYNNALPRFSIVIDFDSKKSIVRIFATPDTLHKATRVPNPSDKHPLIIMPLRSNSGGIAWANDIERALKIFKK